MTGINMARPTSRWVIAVVVVALVLALAVALGLADQYRRRGSGAERQVQSVPLTEEQHRLRADASLGLIHLSLPDGSSKVRWSPASSMKGSEISDAAVVSFTVAPTEAILKAYCPEHSGRLLKVSDIPPAWRGESPETFGLSSGEAEALDAQNVPEDTGRCRNAISDGRDTLTWHVQVSPGSPAEFRVLLYRSKAR